MILIGLCLKIGFAQKRPSFDVVGRKLTSLGCVGCRTTSSICSFGCPLGSIPEVNQDLDFEMQKFQLFVLNANDHGGSYQFQKAVLELFERFRNCFLVSVPTET